MLLCVSPWAQMPAAQLALTRALKQRAKRPLRAPRPAHGVLRSYDDDDDKCVLYDAPASLAHVARGLLQVRQTPARPRLTWTDAARPRLRMLAPAILVAHAMWSKPRAVYGWHVWPSHVRIKCPAQ